MSFNSTLGDVSVGAGQISGILQTALGILGIFTQLREQWKAAHPDQPVPQEWTDETLIALLRQDSQALIDAAKSLGAATAPPTQG
jgi:hypothetical protein